MDHFFSSDQTYSIHQAATCDSCSYTCFFESALSSQQQCGIASSQCGAEDKFDQYNFFYVLFCMFNSSLYIFLPFSIFIMYLIFGFISATVEEYISGGITYLSEYLGLSEALAAVTLLALANGAGDVITAIVSSSSEGGISYNIGALYGAGFFVCSMVICLTILSSPNKIIVDQSTIYRDIGFYILSAVVTIWYALIGEIYTWSAILFIVIYALMVLVVYIQDIVEKNEKEKEKDEEQVKQEVQQSEKMNLSLKQNPIKKLKSYGNNILKRVKVARQMNTLLDKKKLLKHATLMTEQNEEGEGEDEEKSFSELNVFEKVMYPFEQVLDFLRKITMPPSEKEKYDKVLCIIWPFPGILFLFFGFGILTFNNYLMYGLPLSFVVSMFFYYTQKDLEKEEVPSYFLWISMLSTIVGLLWTYIACAMLIDLLNTFIVIFKLNQTYMGLTVLGVGNALPDALTTVALAKKGYAQMGITGSYAGQLFGLLIGFGLAQLKTTLMNGPQPFSLFDDLEENALDILVIGFCLINLIATAIYAILNKYDFGKGLAYLVGFLYITFFILATGVQGYYLYEGK